MSWYCSVAPQDPVHEPYHDQEYGFPSADETTLFERLCLEIFQAGLNWKLILQRRPGLSAAFDGFDVETVAAYGDTDRSRLLADSRIIRNARKVDAILFNARAAHALRGQGGLAGWLAAGHPRSKAAWITYHKQIFRFMGPEIVGEFLMSIGYLPGAHHRDCPVARRLFQERLPWLEAVRTGFSGYGSDEEIANYLPRGEAND